MSELDDHLRELGQEPVRSQADPIPPVDSSLYAGFKIAVFLVITLLIAAIVILLIRAPSWFWHPLGLCTGTPYQVVRCKSYNFFSGSFSDISQITLLSGLILGFGTFYHRHNCHVYGCPRMSWHPDPERGNHPVCKRHHGDHPKGGGKRL